MNALDPHPSSQNPIRTASRRLRLLLSDTSVRPSKVDFLQFLALLEEYCAAASPTLTHGESVAARLARLERQQVETIRLLYRLLSGFERGQPRRLTPAELRDLADQLERLDHELDPEETQ